VKKGECEEEERGGRGMEGRGIGGRGKGRKG
jgi:hypothetical protein